MVLTDDQVQRLVTTCISRRTDYAIQRDNGQYARVGRVLTYDTLRLHLTGVQTLGTYVIDEQETCRFAVFDDDSPRGLARLLQVQHALAQTGIVSYLEGSRRGGHLWVFLASLVSPLLVRRWLLPSRSQPCLLSSTLRSRRAGPIAYV